jgi:hypothetical protein
MRAEVAHIVQLFGQDFLDSSDGVACCFPINVSDLRSGVSGVGGSVVLWVGGGI